jgi:hypothetical protein
MNRFVDAMFLSLLLAGCSCGGIQGGDNDDGDNDGNGADSTADNGGGDNGLPDSDGVVDLGEVCGEAAFNVGRVIPDMLILLDRSLSMTMSEPRLWDIIRPALVTVTSATDDGIWYGLMAFPNSIDPDACGGGGYGNQCSPPTGVLVPVGPGTSGTIASTLDSLDTCGATPTALSLENAHQALVASPTGHPQYILLATDGAPNCNESLDDNTCRCSLGDCNGSPQYCLDDVRTYASLDAACAAGIHTFVLGMGGASEFADVLEQMAVHGCTTTYYAAQEPDEIQAALDAITGSVATCQYEVSCADIPDTTRVNFYFDGVVVPRNPAHESGWDWTDPCESTSDTRGAIEFYGSHCDTIMSGGVASITAAYGCPSTMI